MQFSKRWTAIGACALALTGAAQAAPAPKMTQAAPKMTAPNEPKPPRVTAPAYYGKIVSQTYDKTQMVTETRLANGLTILSKEVHAAPVAYFSVWYKVGSRNEITGRTGLSHILEHMMFKGTHDLPPGSIDHLFTSNGGQINASTGEDRTEYHELIAADRLELAVRVEADRMENSVFDPKELAHEMVVVRSELEGDSNDPGYQLYAFTFLPAAFTAHPYHWPVIGWTEDVEAVAGKRDVIYDYYRQHYMPNNAVVVMVGDFDTKKAVGLCQKYFGVYPQGTLSEHNITPEPPQRGERRVVLKRPGTTGQILIGYHVPGLGTKDHYTLDVVSQLLSGGRSARLYQSLVETGLAESAGGFSQDQRDPYLFILDGTPRAGVANGRLEQGLEAEVARLQATPPTQDELNRAVRQIEASFIFNNDSVSEQANQLGTYAAIGSFTYLDTYLDNIRKVTPQDVQAVAKAYFTPDNRTVATFEPQPLPAGQTLPPPPGEKNFGAAAPVTDPKQKAVLAALDKKFHLQSAATAQAKRPEPKRVVLPNGMTVIVEENHANKTVALMGLVKAGSMFDPDGRYDTAGLTAQMLARGTTTKTALQLALGLESVGASVGIGAGDEAANFSGHCLAKDFTLTLGTLADELQRSAFPQAELDKVRGQTLSGLEQARQDTGGTGGAGTQAEFAFADALYPKGHPYWAPTLDQSEASVKTLTRADLVSFYKTYYRPDTTTLVVVGDVNADDAIAQIKAAFGGWARPSMPAPVVSIPSVPLPATAPAPQLIAIPDTSQTSVLWGYPGQLTRTAPDFYAAYTMNYILGGGAFGSRLGKAIRDQEGLTYTVYSSFAAQHGAGAFSVFLGTNPNNANRAIYELNRIVTTLRQNGITPEELTEAKAYLTGSYPLRLETNAGVAGQLLTAEDYGLGLDYIQKRSDFFRAVTLDQVNAAVKKYLHPDKATLIIAGAAPGK